VIEKPPVTEEQLEEDVEFARELDSVPTFEEFEDFAKQFPEAGKSIESLKSEYHKIGSLSFS